MTIVAIWRNAIKHSIEPSLHCGEISLSAALDAERLQVLLRGSTEKLPVSRTFTHLFRD